MATTFGDNVKRFINNLRASGRDNDYEASGAREDERDMFDEEYYSDEEYVPEPLNQQFQRDRAAGRGADRRPQNARQQTGRGGDYESQQQYQQRDGQYQNQGRQNQQDRRQPSQDQRYQRQYDNEEQAAYDSQSAYDGYGGQAAFNGHYEHGSQAGYGGQSAYGAAQGSRGGYARGGAPGQASDLGAARGAQRGVAGSGVYGGGQSPAYGQGSGVGGNVVQFPQRGVAAGSVIIKAKPEKYSDAVAICQHLRERHIVIFNLSEMDPDTARCVFDFISGAVCVLDATMDKHARMTFSVAPNNVLRKAFREESPNTGFETYTGRSAREPRAQSAGVGRGY